MIGIVKELKVSWILQPNSLNRVIFLVCLIRSWINIAKLTTNNRNHTKINKYLSKNSLRTFRL